MTRKVQAGTPPQEAGETGESRREARSSGREQRAWRLAATAVVVVAVTGGALVLATGFGGQTGGRGASAGAPLVGEPAPSLPSDSLSDEPADVDPTGDQVLLVNFWASWCPPCREEFPVLLQAQRELGDQGLQVVAINSQDQPGTARAFLDEMNARQAFPHLVDPDGEVAVEWGVFGLPETFVVADGTVTAKTVGLLQQDWIAEELEPLLEGGS